MNDYRCEPAMEMLAYVLLYAAIALIVVFGVGMVLL